MSATACMIKSNAAARERRREARKRERQKADARKSQRAEKAFWQRISLSK